MAKFEEMRKLHFENLKEEESMELIDYLISNYPKKLRIFAFDASFDTWYGSGDFYLEGIEKVRNYEYYFKIIEN